MLPLHEKYIGHWTQSADISFSIRIEKEKTNIEVQSRKQKDTQESDR